MGGFKTFYYDKKGKYILFFGFYAIFFIVLAILFRVARAEAPKDTPKEEKRKSMGFLASAISDAEIEPEEEDDEDYEDD